MRPRRSLPIAVTALLAAALVLVGPQPAAAGHVAGHPTITPAQARARAQALAQCASVRAVTDEASATSIATRCQRRVEVLGKRSQTSEVYAEPTGAMTLEQHAVPVRVMGADGQWRPVDTTLVRRPDGALTPAATTVPVRISAGGTGPLVTVGRTGAEWTLSWPAALPTPAVSGDAATYADVLPGVDLVVRATVDGFTHVLVVKTATAARNPALRTIRYRTGGDRLLSAGPALMWDSSTDADGLNSTAAEPGTAAKTVEMPVRTRGNDLLITPDRAMLNSPTTHFPVYLDPPFTANATRWAYADNQNINNNADGRAWVGQDPTNPQYYRTFYDFTIASIAYTHIISASLEAELYHSWSCQDSPVYLYSSTSVISTPRSTWSSMHLYTYLDGESAHAHKGLTSCGNQPDVVMWFNGGLTGDVQAAVNMNWTLYSVGFCACSSNTGAGETTTSRWKKFLPSTVVLHVTYNHAPYSPTSQATDPAAPCVSGPGRPAINTWTPLLKATLSDPDLDVLQGYFYYSTTGVAPWTLIGVTAGQASGQIHSIPMPDLSASAPAFIAWHVNSWDGYDNGWGAVCEFTVDTTPPGTPVLNFGATLPAFPSPPPATVKVGTPISVPMGASADTDIAGYWYSVDVSQISPPRGFFAPAAADGSATLTITPVVSGFSLNWLTLQAVDRAGNFSGEVTYQFRANPAS